MEMLERYLNEVGKYLLKKDRNDIQNKVKSSVLSIMEQKKSEGIEEEEALRLSLIEMGLPEEVARKHDPRLGYLVGPKLFRIYKMVIGFSILGISIGLATPQIVQLSFNPDMNVGSSLMELFGQIFAGAISIIGSITLVFYIIQRYFAIDVIETKEKWNPDKLPKLPKKVEKVSRAGEIASIVVTIVIMFIFNFHPEVIGAFYTVDGGPYIFESLLSADKIETYLIFLNPLWITIIFLHVYELSRGKKTVVSKVISSLVAMGVVATLWVMLGDMGVLENVGSWAQPFASSLRMGFTVVLVVLVVDIIRYFIVYRRMI